MESFWLLANSIKVVCSPNFLYNPIHMLIKTPIIDSQNSLNHSSKIKKGPFIIIELQILSLSIHLSSTFIILNSWTSHSSSSSLPIQHITFITSNSSNNTLSEKQRRMGRRNWKLRQEKEFHIHYLEALSSPIPYSLARYVWKCPLFVVFLLLECGAVRGDSKPQSHGLWIFRESI